MTDAPNTTKKLDDPLANKPLKTYKWLLLKKGDQQRVIKNRVNIILACGFFVVPFLLLLNIIIHRLWGLLISLVVFCAIAAVIAASLNRSDGTIVMAIFQCGFSFFYCLSRSESIRNRLFKKGWQIQAGSNGFTKSAAINQWNKENISVYEQDIFSRFSD